MGTQWNVPSEKVHTVQQRPVPIALTVPAQYFISSLAEQRRVTAKLLPTTNQLNYEIVMNVALLHISCFVEQ